MLDEIFGALLQLLVFTTLPFLVYVIQTKSVKGFGNYIGITRSTPKANVLAIATSLLFAAPLLLLTLISEEFQTIMFDPTSITGKFRNMEFGAEALTILLVMALFKTSLTEEILFRGFVAKRLIGLLGFRNGNLAQATFFGIIHTALFALITDNTLFLTIIFVVPSIGAYVTVILNEKLANGSILPGWIAHALANVLAYSLVGFVL